MCKQNAYLIMAHTDFEILKKTISILDDKDADFYIHIDCKAKDFDLDELKKCIDKSDMYFITSSDIRWGDRIQVDLEINMLREAIKKKYKYYHLLSGVDFPLKKPEYINQFFEDHNGKNFIDFGERNQNAIDRLKYYYFFQKATGHRKSFLFYIQKILLILQKIIKVNRIRGKEDEIYKGANWFSINHDLASYVVSNFYKYDKMFDRTVCADEIFLQTMVMASPYKETVINECLREIDWKRGNPYVYQKCDYELLVNSDNIFARKFSTKIDNEIIEKLYKYLSE